MGIIRLSVSLKNSSSVNQVGMASPHMKNTDVMKIARTFDKNRVFHIDRFDASMLPVPRWNASRIDPADAIPVVEDSNKSQIDSRMPHAATVKFKKRISVCKVKALEGLEASCLSLTFSRPEKCCEKCKCLPLHNQSNMQTG